MELPGTAAAGADNQAVALAGRHSLDYKTVVHMAVVGVARHMHHKVVVVVGEAPGHKEAGLLEVDCNHTVGVVAAHTGVAELDYMEVARHRVVEWVEGIVLEAAGRNTVVEEVPVHREAVDMAVGRREVVASLRSKLSAAFHSV